MSLAVPLSRLSTNSSTYYQLMTKNINIYLMTDLCDWISEIWRDIARELRVIIECNATGCCGISMSIIPSVTRAFPFSSVSCVRDEYRTCDRDRLQLTTVLKKRLQWTINHITTLEEQIPGSSGKKKRRLTLFRGVIAFFCHALQYNCFFKCTYEELKCVY